jgi:thioesterase domain-containing protein
LLIGGYSFGNIIASALATAYPDLAAGLILLDPLPPGTAGMTSDEVETLIPSELMRFLSALSARARTQIKMNAQSMSIEADRQAGHQELVDNLRVPIYLINATKPLNHLAGVQTNSSPGSCLEWMLDRQRASMAEQAWSDILGNLLVGTERIAGDHFSMFTRTHAGSTTRAIKQAADALEAIIA